MNVQVRTWMTDSQCVQVKPQRLYQNSPWAVARPISEAQRYRITQHSVRTEVELTESRGESGTNTRHNSSHVFRTVPDARANRETDELWRCSHRAHDHIGDGDSRTAHIPSTTVPAARMKRTTVVRVRRRTQSRTNARGMQCSEGGLR